MRWRIKTLPIWLVFVWVHWSAGASEFQVLSPLEKAAAIRALKSLKLKIDPRPEQKKIGQIFVYTEAPFSKKDGILQIGNDLHIITRDEIVLQDVLLDPGEEFDENLVIQSEQQLRDPRFRSLALILPVQPSKGARAGFVDLLVVSRDVWSLRLSTDLSINGSSVNYFVLSLGDNNIAGLNKLASVTYRLQPRHFELAATYYDPKLFMSRHQLLVEPAIILNRNDSSYAGVKGKLQFALPLYSERDKWGYALKAEFASRPIIDLVDGQARTFSAKDSSEEVERKYHWLTLESSATATRSFGTKLKNNLTFGYGLNIYEPTLFDDFPLQGKDKEAFVKEVLPRKELESFLILGHKFFENRFTAIYDLNTYALAEYFRLGPELGVTTHWGLKPILQSDHDFVRVAAQIGYALSMPWVSLLKLKFSGETRLQGGFVDNLVSASIFGASTRIFGAGRLVLNGLLARRFDDRNGRILKIGGSNGLRGTVSGFYRGRNLFVNNLEFRSVALPLWILRIGGVGFYDVGAAFDEVSTPNLTHSVGLGLRILLVQLNRNVIRLDYAIPVAGPRSGFTNGLFSMGFGQAF